MAKSGFYHRLRKSAHMRTILFGIGLFLMILAPIIGPLPGPGFIVLFPAGLALCLQNSKWAKRRYARFKRRRPRYAEWTDRIMRRGSAARRRERQDLTSSCKNPVHRPPDDD
jgi:ribosomal protein L24E